MHTYIWARGRASRYSAHRPSTQACHQLRGADTDALVSHNKIYICICIHIYVYIYTYMWARDPASPCLAHRRLQKACHQLKENTRHRRTSESQQCIYIHISVYVLSDSPYEEGARPSISVFGTPPIEASMPPAVGHERTTVYMCICVYIYACIYIYI